MSKPQNPMTSSPTQSQVQRYVFGTMPDGQEVNCLQLSHPEGISVSIIELGATMQSLWAPDSSGKAEDVVLGYDDVDGYLQGEAYFGAVVGRYANRIAGGHFQLGDVDIQLETNEGNNHLHGGHHGYERRLWQGSIIASNCVEFALTSPDGDQGYPGSLDVRARYTLTSPLTLQIRLTATCDSDTVVNLTQHSYYNLAGHNSGSIGGHILQVLSQRFAPIDAEMLPLGELHDVAGGPFDLRSPRRVGDCLGTIEQQLEIAGGFDHSWELTADLTTPSAVLTDPLSGRTLKVSTDQPAMQVYTGNGLGNDRCHKGDNAYQPRSGICLEAQDFPDAPNNPMFPETRLTAGQTYQRYIQLEFSCQ